MSLLKTWKLRKELREYIGETDKNVWVKERKKSNKKRYSMWLLIISLFFLNFYYFKVNRISVLSGISLVFFGIFFEIMENNKKLKQKINELEAEQEYIESKVTRQVKANENLKKQNIKHIILKDDEGYDLKTWKIDHLYSLIIGKRNPLNHVEIDLTNTMYSSLISREHGILNRCDEGWYYEDLDSLNGSGIEKKDNRRKVKVPKGRAIKVESGDIIYISNTKLLLE